MKLRSSRPAPSSNATDSATWTTTRPGRGDGAGDPSSRRGLARRATRAGSTRLACQAGAEAEARGRRRRQSNGGGGDAPPRPARRALQRPAVSARGQRQRRSRGSPTRRGRGRRVRRASRASRLSVASCRTQAPALAPERTRSASSDRRRAHGPRHQQASEVDPRDEEQRRRRPSPAAGASGRRASPPGVVEASRRRRRTFVERVVPGKTGRRDHAHLRGRAAEADAGFQPTEALEQSRAR